MLIFAGLLIATGVVSNELVAEDGGDGTFESPYWYSYQDEWGNGVWHKRGQTLLGAFRANSDQGHDFVSGLIKNSYGESHFRLDTVTVLPDQSTKVESEVIDLILKVEPIAGGNDKVEFRNQNMLVERVISQNQTFGSINANVTQQSMAAPIGGAVPESTEYFTFDFNTGSPTGGAWAFDLYTDEDGDVLVCESHSGDFNGNTSFDLTSVDAYAFFTQIGNLLDAQDVSDYVQFVISYPDPYFDFYFEELEHGYIFEHKAEA